MSGTVIILGAGSPNGVGGALARRFAAQGHHVIVTGRTLDKVATVAEQVTAAGGSAEAMQVDVTSEADQDRLFSESAAKGPIAAVLYNAGNNAIIPFEDLSTELMNDFMRVGFFGAFLAAKRAIPILKGQGRGSLFFTGASASLRGKANFAHFAAAKGALRNLAQALAREFGPAGVHVAHFIIDGIIDGEKARTGFPEYLESLGEGGVLEPDAIAEAFWFAHQQPPSAWTHEMDLRPQRENW